MQSVQRALAEQGFLERCQRSALRRGALYLLRAPRTRSWSEGKSDRGELVELLRR